jgi:Probable zinc-ribbon domain
MKAMAVDPRDSADQFRDLMRARWLIERATLDGAARGALLRLLEATISQVAQAAGDLRRTCTDCGAGFLFTIADQLAFARRAFTPPRRCPACRKRARDGGRATSAGETRP